MAVLPKCLESRKFSGSRRRRKGIAGTLTHEQARQFDMRWPAKLADRTQLCEGEPGVGEPERLARTL